MSDTKTMRRSGTRPTVSSSQVVRRPGPAELNSASHRRRRLLLENLLRWGTPIVLIAVWQYFATNGTLDRRFWPPPSDIVTSLREMVELGTLQDNLWITTQRLFIGYVSGSVIGILVGFALGANRWFRVALEPLISALYTVPKLAIFPLLLVIFGLGETPKIILTALAAFFICCISTISAVLSIPTAMREPLRSFNAGWLQEFRHLVFPAILPAVFVSLRLAAGMAVLVLVGMEMIQGGSGLGFLIWSSWQIFDTDRMYVGIVVAAIYGVVFQALVQLGGRLATPWERDTRSK